MFWSQLAAQIETFQLHLVTVTYGEGEAAAWKAEFWTVVITMLQVICKELRKVRVEAETVYGSEKSTEMVGQCLWGTLQAHWVMDDAL